MQTSTTISSNQSILGRLTQQQRILIGAAIIVLVAIAWYLFRPELLFVNKTVNEKFPTTSAANPASSDQNSTVLGSGMFHSGAHETKGTATVYELKDGERVLRLTDFETSNGPAVYVYLVAARDVLDNATVERADYVDLGSLKGNIGDQNYDIPKGTDLSKYHAVTIWCKRFSVNFGTAPLSDNKMADSQMGRGKMSDTKMNEDKMVSDAKMAGDKMDNGTMSDHMTSGGAMSEGKMSDAKMSEGKMTPDRKMSDDKTMSTNH
jgi:hypothetical protein